MVDVELIQGASRVVWWHDSKRAERLPFREALSSERDADSAQLRLVLRGRGWTPHGGK